MRDTFKIFAICKDETIKRLIIKEFKNEKNEVVFFGDDFSLIQLMGFQPDMIIQDYQKREFFFNQNSTLANSAA